MAVLTFPANPLPKNVYQDSTNFNVIQWFIIFHFLILYSTFCK